MNPPFRLGLTGSIGMGKTTTARMFAEEGVPVWDADAAVHRLYRTDGAAVPAVAALVPAAISERGVDRAVLSDWLSRDPGNLARLEAAVHPLVARDRDEFLETSQAPVVLLDIPLLFETGLDAAMDATVVVTVPDDVQRARVLARPGMTEEKFTRILARQMPDAEKRRKADYVIETLTLEDARAQVQDVLRDIWGKIDARNRAGHGNDRIRSEDG